jgi:amidohydrolase family protein
MSNKLITLCVLLAILHSGAVSKAPNPLAKTSYDLVILNGRVIDPESGLDAIRNVGVKAGTIQALTTEPLEGRVTVDARDLVVAPGFIDLHQHRQDNENHSLKAMDGVTTALELEIGTADVDRWYAERLGKPLINYGVSIGHPPTRMAIMHDSGDFLPTGDAAKVDIRESIRRGPAECCPGTGNFGICQREMGILGNRGLK